MFVSPIAVIFHRLGPYHFARLRAAGRQLAVVAIETSGRDETYAWDKVVGGDSFERVTLFENADAQKEPAREVAGRVSSALDRLRPRVVAVPGWSDIAALAALRWSLKHGVPAVCMSESTEWDARRSAWSEMVKHQVVGLFSAALVGGLPHRDYMVKLGMAPERVFVGYDAVDNRHFLENAEKLKPETLKTEAKKKYGLPEKFFLASARFVEKKNLPRLIRSYARYRELASSSQLPAPGSQPWDLVLLGDGKLRSGLQSQVSSLGLQHCVLMPGFKQYPDLPAYYGLAGAFIHASTTEQWGLVVNEAMASGQPVLVSNRCGCARDLVQEGVNGFTFDPYNVEQLAELLFQVSGFSSSLLSEMGSESQRIISEWGPERFATGLKQAAECALRVGPAKASLLQQGIIRALMLR